MKGYLNITLADGRKLYEENDLFEYEVSRLFRQFVTGFHLSLPSGTGVTRIAGHTQYKGNHILDVQNGKFPRIQPGLSTGNPASGTAFTIDFPRYRVRATPSFSAPLSPGQTAFALHSVGVFDTGTTPAQHLSSVDIGVRQIGAPFGHPAGRRSYFNEPLQVPSGVGVVTPGGTFAPTPKSEMSYIYDVRIKTSGSSTTGAYVFRRRPWFMGSYEPGSTITDAYGANALVNRIPATTAFPQVLDITALGLSTAGLPSEVPYNDSYPTAATLAGGGSAYPGMVGMAYDELPDGRIWWCLVDPKASNDANASRGRCVWSWKRMSMEAFARMDTTLTGFPALASNTQFRDLKCGRGGLLYLAADGNDDANNGSDSGALIVINASTLAVVAVIGNAVGGIYTTGGLPENNVLGVTVDRTETRAAVGYDRVWIMTRAGLAYADVNVNTAAIGAFTALTGAPINAGSLRARGGFSVVDGSGPFVNFRNLLAPLIDHDSNGDVYWVSSPLVAGIHRLNKITGDGATHTWLSLDGVAEGGAAGFLSLGIDVPSSSVGRMLRSLHIHRRDLGDPDADDLWVGSDYASSSGGNYPAARIPISVFSGDVLASGSTQKWPGTQFTQLSTAGGVRLNVAPDGSCLALTLPASGMLPALNILESLGRISSGADFDVDNTYSSAGQYCPTNWFIDDTGIAYIFWPTAITSQGPHVLHAFMPISYQWDGGGSRWYRSRFPTLAAAVGRTCHTTAQELVDGVTVSFADGAGGPTIFVANEYYTWVASLGVAKDATQSLTFNYDFYSEKTEFVFTDPTKTAAQPSASSAWLASSAAESVNPFTAGSAASRSQLANYQRSVYLDGLNNTYDWETAGIALNTTDKVHWGLDLGSDQTTSALRFCLKTSGDPYQFLLCDVYSCKNADAPGGIPVWTLRHQYKYDEDHPDFSIQTDAMHKLTAWPNISFDQSTSANEISIDLAAMVAGARISNGTDLSQRFWKIVFYRGGSGTHTITALSATAFDGSGLPIGLSANQYLSKSIDSDYLANYLVRGVWIEDSGIGTATRLGTSQVTLSGDAFTIVLSGVGNGTTDNITAPVADVQTLTLAGGTFTSAQVGRLITITGAANSSNNGVFVITAQGGTTISYTNSIGVVEANFAGSWSTNGISANDFFRARIVGTLDGFNAPVSGIQTLTDASALWVPEDKGRLVVVTGATNAAANNGSFIVTRVISSTTIQVRNPNGVVEAVTSAAWRIDRENKILSVDSSTQLTFTAPAQPFTSVDWEVVRNADIRPRDDEGGGENTPRFPAAGGEVFCCPVTGGSVYHSKDVERARTFRPERYIKVRRGI